MIFLDLNKIRSTNQVEIVAYVDKFNFNNISEEYFNNSDKVVFRFFELNEKMSRDIRKIGLKKYDCMNQSYYCYDYFNRKEFILKNLLSYCHLDFEIKLERDEFGSLTNDCLEYILKIHPSILDYFLTMYEESFSISDEYNDKLINQCHRLFADGSKGISDADESVSVYCNLVGFWEKMGLNYYDIQNLPEDLFYKLNLIMKKDNEMQIQKIEKSNKSSKSSNSGNIIGSFNF